MNNHNQFCVKIVSCKLKTDHDFQEIQLLLLRETKYEPLAEKEEGQQVK